MIIQGNWFSWFQANKAAKFNYNYCNNKILLQINLFHNKSKPHEKQTCCLCWVGSWHWSTKMDLMTPSTKFCFNKAFLLENNTFLLENITLYLRKHISPERTLRCCLVKEIHKIQPILNCIYVWLYSCLSQHLSQNTARTGTICPEI